ncbi:Monoterpene epsilon-lactone hydrolase [Enhygromyxa salina]|uniref:Monoterpene epsilon-lactone hydrolase n=1 Tax=Enhygromyxa salina TaxID=215803 RepID=A0A2S9XDK3_9BACT|nr:alpha/beta hydrolase [Enhygromyxa salina]PRP90944.1 Monoterpene epsilon-lactone hydrolase [Enhygromyxa salina]
MLDAMGAEAEMPAGVAVERGTVAEVPVEWLTPTNEATRVVLHLHGGGFALGSCQSHRALAARIGVASKARVVVPDYRLAPENPFPAGLDDVVEVYAALLADGLRAEQIVVSGDSAGGNLALSTLLRAAARGLPMPRAVVLLSPWTDLTLTGESLETRAAVDPWLQPEMLEPMRETYLGGGDPADPFASPLWGDLSLFPPTLVHVGDHEILLSDSQRLVERAAAAGVDVELHVGQELWHVWHLFSPGLPDANDALARIGAFVEARFTDGR